MSKINDLVPPLELCKLIPPGEFEDSAFIWVNGMNNKSKVICRPWDKKSTAAPAPTLQEIMAKIPYCRVYKKTTGTFIAVHEKIRFAVSKNGAAAALKLWLRLKGVECK